MAKQAGALPFTGSIGGVTGYKRNGKYCLKEKSGPSREQVLTSKKFARTRENAREFRRTTKAGKLVRSCLANLTKSMQLADNEISARLNGLLSKIVKSDPVHDRGERTVSKGQLEWLEDFAFRKEASFGSVCTMCPASTMDTDSGYMKVEIRAFDPQQRMNAPQGATHFKVVANGAAIDFEKERMDWNYRETSFRSLSEYVDEAIILEQTLKPRPGEALLHAIGIAFYRQGEDGHFERVPGGVMRILQVSEPGFNGVERIDGKDVEAVTATALRILHGAIEYVTDTTAAVEDLNGINNWRSLFTKSRDKPIVFVIDENPLLQRVDFSSAV